MKKTFFILFFALCVSCANAMPIVYQAENGILNGTVIASVFPGYQGTGYVDGYTAPGYSCSVTVNAPASGVYMITLGYRSEFGMKYNDLYINNTFYAAVTFTMTASFTAAEAGQFFLNAGNNDLKLVYNWGYIQLDWLAIELVPATAQQISNYDLMPASVSTGQQDVYAVMYKLKNPSGGVALVKGITFTVKDSASNLINASSALSAFSIRDESAALYGPAAAQASSYIYCNIPAGIQVPAFSEKNIYAVMDITGNTTARAADFKIDLDSSINIRAEDFTGGNTLMVTAAAGFNFPEGSTAAYIQNRAAELSVSHTDAMPASASTSQLNVRAMELRFTDIGDTMTANVKVSRITFEIQDAAGNSIASNTAVKKLKITSTDGSFVYGEVFSSAASRLAIVLSAPLIVPSTQDFTCAVMLDITDTLSAASCRISVEGQGDIYAVDGNSSEPVLVTSGTAFPKTSGAAAIQIKADSINADNFTALLPAGVVKGQKWVELFSFRLSDTLGAQSAQALFNGLTISAENSGGYPAPANGTIEKFYITDSLGGILGSVSAGVSADTYLPLLAASVFTSGVSKYFRVFADILTTAYLPGFRASMQSSGAFSVTDKNSGYEATKNAAAMPWNTAAAWVFDAPATDMHVSHDGNVAPTMAGLGQPDVKFMNLHAYNPGFIGTADIMIKGVTLTVVDNSNNIVAPSSVLENLYVTNIAGDTVYGQFNALPATTAAPFYVPFSSALYVDALNTKNAYISGDIGLYAVQGVYKMRLATEADFDRLSVPAGFVAVTAVSPDSFPLESNPVTITALAYNFNAGHTDLMPVSVAQGSAGVEALAINFENYNSVPIGVTSLAISVKNCGGALIAANSVINSMTLVDRDNNTIIYMSPGASGRVNMTGFNFKVASGAEKEMKIRVDLQAAALTPFYIELEAGTDVSTLPLATVNPANNDFFGNMKSGCVSIQEKSLEGSFHAFPNPFDPDAGSASVEYYLENNAELTIKIYTMNGNLVKTVVDRVMKSEGLHFEDKWDGTNAAGRAVKSGVYLCVIEAGGKTLTRKVAVLR